MSGTLKWILGIVSAGFALVLIYSERLAPSNAPVVVYLVAAFCLATTIACFSSALRSYALRFIGAMVFIATAAYLIYELVYEPHKAYEGRSEPHWLNAIFALAIFGLPGLRLAIAKVGGNKGKPTHVEAAEERANINLYPNANH